MRGLGKVNEKRIQFNKKTNSELVILKKDKIVIIKP
jgi:hypothetical protein